MRRIVPNFSILFARLIISAALFRFEDMVSSSPQHEHFEKKTKHTYDAGGDTDYLLRCRDASLQRRGLSED
jgi:hypothetical protein